jgi:ubiquinone/menaquinone biosynthesis C-methylase UbiE
VDEAFHHIFEDPATHEPLTFVGDVDDDRWGDGSLVSADGRLSIPVQEGTPRFVAPADDPWTTQTVEGIGEQYGIDPTTLIEMNVTKVLHHWPDRKLYDDWIGEFATSSGPIIEIACGPAGGMAPLILDANPEAPLLMTDLGGWILEQWQSYAIRRGDWPRLSFAQIDVTKAPIRDGVFSTVTSFGGLSNVADQSMALQKVYGMLVPSGKLCIVEAIPERESLLTLPEEVINRLANSYQALSRGFDSLLEAGGFKVMEMIETTRRQMLPNESSLAEVATSRGITLDLCFYRITAVRA